MDSPPSIWVRSGLPQRQAALFRRWYVRACLCAVLHFLLVRELRRLRKSFSIPHISYRFISWASELASSILNIPEELHYPGRRSCIEQTLPSQT
jgi:hypothetical protein